jgi:hypothetical protein
MSSIYNCRSYGIKNYDIEIAYKGMTFLLKFMKICNLVQKLLREIHGRLDDLMTHFPALRKEF